MTGLKLSAGLVLRWEPQQYSDLSSLAPLARGICFPRPSDGLEEFDGLAPVGGQVVPSGVVALDQGDASSANPVFDFFLAVNGGADKLIHLEVHQPVDFVLLGEACDFPALVLRDPTAKVIGYARVDAARLAGHDVDEVAVFAGHGFLAVVAKADPPCLRSGGARDDNP